MIPGSSEISNGPQELPESYLSLVHINNSYATVIYQDAGTVEITSLDVASRSWMPLEIQVFRWTPTCMSCLSVHTDTGMLAYMWERVAVFMSRSICGFLLLLVLFFGCCCLVCFSCSHKQDKAVKSTLLVALSYWLDYCNRDCSLLPQSFRQRLGEGTPLNPFLRDPLGLPLASVIQDLQDGSTTASNSKCLAKRATRMTLALTMVSWACMYWNFASPAHQ